MIRVFQIKQDERENLYPDSSFNYGTSDFDPIANINRYHHVADLDVATLDEAFHVGNVGPAEKYTRYEKMHSVSVGDILVDGDNTVSIVSDFGFDELDVNCLMNSGFRGILSV